MMGERKIVWAKCGTDGSVFCPLETVNLSGVDTTGVYVIWHNTSARVIYVGEGHIADRLYAHRTNPEMLGHRGEGLLLVTWATVEDDLTRLGIERYLGELWRPLVGGDFRNVNPIKVNLPE